MSRMEGVTLTTENNIMGWWLRQLTLLLSISKSRVTFTTKNNIMSLLIYDSLHTHNVECLWMDQKYKLWTFCTLTTTTPHRPKQLASTFLIHHPSYISTYHTWHHQTHDWGMCQEICTINNHQMLKITILNSMSCLDIISCSLKNLRISCMLFICLDYLFCCINAACKTKVSIYENIYFK